MIQADVYFPWKRILKLKKILIWIKKFLNFCEFWSYEIFCTKVKILILDWNFCILNLYILSLHSKLLYFQYVSYAKSYLNWFPSFPLSRQNYIYVWKILSSMSEYNYLRELLAPIAKPFLLLPYDILDSRQYNEAKIVTLTPQGIQLSIKIWQCAFTELLVVRNST